MIRKISATVLIIAMLIGYSMSAIAVYPIQNIIENGSFDDDLDSWDILESENFTITGEGGYAKFNTTDTDYLYDVNYTDFQAGTGYNFTIQSGDITGEGSTGYMEFVNTTTVRNLNTYMNESEGNWTYDEYDKTSNFIRSKYNTSEYVSSSESASIESRKLYDYATIINEDFSTNPSLTYSGLGSTKYIWNSTGQKMDCTWTGGSSNFARASYQIPPKNKSSSYGMSCELSRNKTGTEGYLGSYAVGFFNSSSTNNTWNSILIKFTVIGVSPSPIRYRLDAYRGFDNGSYLTSLGNLNLNESEMNYGFVLNITVKGWLVKAEVFNKTTWASMGSVGISGMGEYFIDCMGIGSYDFGGAYTTTGYLDNLYAYENSTGLGTVVAGRYTQGFNTTMNSTINVDINRKHYHDAQAGFIRSTTEVEYEDPIEVTNETIGQDDELYHWLPNDRIINATFYIIDGDWAVDILIEGEDYELNETTGWLDTSLWGVGDGDNIHAWYNYTKYESIYNESSTSTTSWTKENNSFQGNVDNYTVKLWTYHTVTEGQTNYPAKTTYWDNCYVNSTYYAWNGTYESQVLNRSYFADWGKVDIYFSDTFYNIDMRFNFSLYLRSGSKPTVEPVNWTSWMPITDFKYISGAMTYDLYHGTNPCPNNQYIQYKLLLYSSTTAITPEFDGVVLSSTPIAISKDWGMINQTITKPYTEDCLFKYSFKISELNNSKNGTFFAYINDQLINQENFTYFETDWIDRNISLPTTYNASGSYNIKFKAYFEFNSTNGTGTILLDDTEFLIENQAPTILEFNVLNETAIKFNGTFTDFSRGSDYDFLGLEGISEIKIYINGFELEVDDVEYIGNGYFTFNHTWASTPFEMSDSIILGARLTILDTEGLSDEEEKTITLPTATGFMISLMSMGLMMMIIMLIFNRHLLTGWDTDKTTSNERLLPNTITGDNKK